MIQVTQKRQSPAILRNMGLDCSTQLSAPVDVPHSGKTYRLNLETQVRSMPYFESKSILNESL